jgi:hypothetical protein
MNYIIAKSGKHLRKVLSQSEDILDYFDITNISSVNFSPTYQLEEDEWFKIESFSNQPFYIELCDSNFSTSSLNQISNQEFEKTKQLCIIQSDIKFFQKITSILFIRSKKFIDASGTPKIVEHRRQLELMSESDAVYFSTNDVLYFRNLSKIKSIFPGIEELHREATQTEVNSFLNNSFIDSQTIDNNKIGSANRKRIADIGVKYNALSQQKKDQLIEYAKEKAGVELNEQGNFKVNTENNLKKLLFAMDERYYRSDIYEENRLANSIRVV